MRPADVTDRVERLFALEQFGIKLGLDNIRTLLAALGHPERAWPSIHIAGTNGKGSVAAMVERGAARRRPSRPAATPRRISIASRSASRSTASRSTRRPSRRAPRDVLDVGRSPCASRRATPGRQPPTFFEVTTAMAFEIFRRAKVDVAVDRSRAGRPLRCDQRADAGDHRDHLDRASITSGTSATRCRRSRSRRPASPSRACRWWSGACREEAAARIAEVARRSRGAAGRCARRTTSAIGRIRR